ncbi:MAG: efflux RND transporter periplasmic adaptor subunit, partial [Thermoanaerobaculia bacterium]|nr:efflux RND transporter periplasmic adaptor subunit [Thermoanaerobaculia bacterium]
IVIVVVAAASVAIGMKQKDKNVKQVTTAKVEKDNLVSKVSSNGKIEAKRKVDISANVMGQIVNLAVREGDRVKKGDFLLQIDKAQLAASAAGAEAGLRALFADRDAARAALDNARRNFARAKANFDQGISPKADFDSAETSLRSAEASLDAAEKRIEQARANLVGARDSLSKTTITAPMAGIVTALPVEEGEVAVIGTMNNAGTKLMTISDMSVVESVMEVDETDIPNVKTGQKATVTIDAYPNRTFTGTVTEVGSSPIEGATGAGGEAVNFEVKIQLDSPSEDIRPGFSCSADIITASRDDVPAIPLAALVMREKAGAKPAGAAKAAAPAPTDKSEEEGVYVFDDATKKVKFTAVETGITGDLSIEIVKGVGPGETIVTGPFRILREIKDGDTVKLEEKKKGKDGGEPQG